MLKILKIHLRYAIDKSKWNYIKYSHNLQNGQENKTEKQKELTPDLSLNIAIILLYKLDIR